MNKLFIAVSIIFVFVVVYLVCGVARNTTDVELTTSPERTTKTVNTFDLSTGHSTSVDYSVEVK